jgi:uncharacterized protein (TIGR04222 family)
MPLSNADLYQRIRDYAFDAEPVSFGFVDRLARDNNWDRAFAERVMDEYRRFVYLALTGTTPVTPSEEVDQAWHLHLTYTHAYWERFCRDTLGRPLHHNPTVGGSAERAKYAEQYEQTRERYRQEFASEPPSDIWPPAVERFGLAALQRRVDLTRHTLVERTALGWQMGWLVWFTGAGLFAWACVLIDPWNLTGAKSLSFHLLAWLGLIPFALVVRYLWLQPADDIPELASELSPRAAAYLRDGKAGVVRVAVAELTTAGILTVAEDGTVASGPTPPSHDPLDRAIFGTSQRHTIHTLQSYIDADKVRPIRESLERLGLVLTWSWMSAVVFWPLLLTWLVPAVGITKIMVGIERGRPVGFLLGFCILAVVISLIVSIAACPRCTRRGAFTLERLQSRYTGLSARAATATEVGWVVGLYGAAALLSTPHRTLAQGLTPKAEGGSGCGAMGCGSGGGSSGDGGGDGGGGGGCGGGGCGGGGCGG